MNQHPETLEPEKEVQKLRDLLIKQDKYFKKTQQELFVEVVD